MTFSAPTSALMENLIDCETDVWQALVTGDQAQDEAALDEEFLGVYPDGFASKAEHVAQLAGGATVAGFELSDFHCMVLGDDHALLSYLASFTRTGNTKAEPMYVSSIWKRNAQTWINVFSQDTPASDWKTV